MIHKYIPKLWRHFKTDSLFRNSAYLIMSTGFLAVFGFTFWIFVARLFSTKDVGVATTLISANSLLSSLALLGFNSSLIRYLPTSAQKNEKINSALILVVGASVLVSMVFLAGLSIFSPHLIFLQKSLFYASSFVIFVVVASLNTIIESVFIAHRASENVVIKNIVLGVLKLVLPPFLIFLGAYGIFTSTMVATVVCCCVGLGILLFKYAYQPAFNFNKDVVKEMAFFSGGNYLAGFFSQASNLILPLLIVNLLNAEAAAYFYVSSMIMNFLLVISQATTQSFLAEGSHDISAIRDHFFKSLKIVFAFLIPAVILIVLFGNLILHAFGKNYARDAFSFLQIVSFSTIFISICALGNSMLRLRHKIGWLVALNLFSAIFTLVVAYIFVPRGLVAIGWSLLLTQIAITVVYFLFFWRQKLI